jgi:hypothetical protein
MFTANADQTETRRDALDLLSDPILPGNATLINSIFNSVKKVQTAEVDHQRTAARGYPDSIPARAAAIRYCECLKQANDGRALYCKGVKVE